MFRTNLQSDVADDDAAAASATPGHRAMPLPTHNTPRRAKVRLLQVS